MGDTDMSDTEFMKMPSDTQADENDEKHTE
jgi:hypothetical protein